MQQSTIWPVDLKVLTNHIYEYKKGVRRMVLFTFNKKYEDFAIHRLKSQNIKFVIQPVGNDRLNLYFGREECLNAIRMIVTRSLNHLTPEEDFMLGAMLGYDICTQCERFCERKGKCNGQTSYGLSNTRSMLASSVSQYCTFPRLSKT